MIKVAKRIDKNMKRSQPIKINVNGQVISSYSGEMIASALTHELGIGYTETRSGETRGPVCNMGVCYECSVHVSGVGNVRACMTRAEEGMKVTTSFNDTELTEVSSDDNEVNRTIQENSSDKTLYDVAIIGAGPGGLGAVNELSHKGLQVIVIDEQEQSGGQIYRQPPEEFGCRESGYSYVKQSIDSSDVEWMHQTAVWAILPKGKNGKTVSDLEDAEYIEVYLDNGSTLLTKHIILATGAYERLLAIPGWHIPGVMSAGGIQIFLKTQGILPGNNTLLVGSHPFLLIVAENIIKNGGNIAGISFSQTFTQLKHIIELGFKSIKHIKKIKELLSAIRTIRKAKIPILYGHLPTAIKGDQTYKEVTLSPIKNNKVQYDEQKIFECNVVGMCFGFNSSTELARQIECDMEYSFQDGGFIVKHNDFMETSFHLLYAAGEVTGIGGAELSEVEGRLAGCGIMKKYMESEKLNSRIKKLRRERHKWASFAHSLNKATKLPESVYDPTLQDPETYICRCEEVTLKQILEAVQDNPGMDSLNAIKLKTRCGMGLCQGRNCEYTLKALVNKCFPDEDAIETNFTVRYPVKPISIKHLTTLE